MHSTETLTCIATFAVRIGKLNYLHIGADPLSVKNCFKTFVIISLPGTSHPIAFILKNKFSRKKWHGCGCLSLPTKLRLRLTVSKSYMGETLALWIICVN